MVKAKIIILTPVYNDWKNLNILLKKIVNIFKKLKKTFELIIINDCSTSKIIIKKINKKILKKISIINLKENQGKQFEDIVEYLGEEDNKKGIKFLVDIWVSHWNSFYQSGGRIIENNNKYFHLSPKNPKSRERNPQVNSFIG